MMWLQGILSLVPWISAGIWASRLAGAMALPRRPWLGVALMVGGAAAMFSGMAVLSNLGGLSGTGLSWPGWLAATVLGCLFTSAQGFGSVWILRSVAGPETGDNGGASNT